MRDRIFFPLAAVLAAGMILLALVWPEGMGAPSPPPFSNSAAVNAKLRPAQP